VEYVRLGGTGLEVSSICLGTWMFGQDMGGGESVDRDMAQETLEAAWSGGINFIDTANIYGQDSSRLIEDPRMSRKAGPGRSESYIGEWLADKDRENFVVASKVYFGSRGRQGTGLSRKLIRAEIEGTLERLGTDYLDLYYIHGWHPSSPLEEALSALNDLVRAGTVHYLGVSNFAAWQLVQARYIAARNGWEQPWVIQPRFNAVDHVPFTADPSEIPLPDLLDACRDQDVAVCAYSALAGGFLSGKYRRGDDGEVVVPDDSRASSTERYGPFPERWWRVLDAVVSVADEVDATPTQVALRWLMMQEGVVCIPIVGARRPRHLVDSVGALEIELSREQRERITRAGDYGYTSVSYTDSPSARE
jgi:aryl-alcohol dehydrogenase-like predicted oxidoreductase